MKSLMFLSFLLVVTVWGDSVQDKWDKVHKECQIDIITHVDEIVFEKLRKNETVTLPPNFGLHALCMLTKLDFLDDNGHIKKDTVEDAVKKNINDINDVKEIEEECSVNKATGESTAFALFDCFKKHRINIGQF